MNRILYTVAMNSNTNAFIFLRQFIYKYAFRKQHIGYALTLRDFWRIF